MLPRSDDVRQVKYIFKEQKQYGAFVRFPRRMRLLHRKDFRTARAAVDYGRKVVERYRRWCDVALAKEMTK